MKLRPRIFSLNRILTAAAAVSIGLLAAPAALAAGGSWLSFDANGLYSTQGTGMNTEAGQVAWTPQLDLSANLAGLSLRYNFGAGLLKSGASSTFVTFNYQALMAYLVIPNVEFAGGGGAQTWVSNGGTHPIITGELSYRPAQRVFGVFDRIFAGYDRFFLPGLGTDEIRLGLGVIF